VKLSVINDGGCRRNAKVNVRRHLFGISTSWLIVCGNLRGYGGGNENNQLAAASAKMAYNVAYRKFIENWRRVNGGGGLAIWPKAIFNGVSNRRSSSAASAGWLKRKVAKLKINGVA